MRVGVWLMVLAVTLCGCGDDRRKNRNFLDGPDTLAPDWPMAFVSRPLPSGDEMQDQVLEPAAFTPGAKLLVKDRAVHTAPELDILSSIIPAERSYDVKDLSANAAGDALLFALKLSPTEEEEETTWDIYHYDLRQGSVRRIIASALQARRGDDIAPAFLADGRIVFSSNRQQSSRARLLDDGKPQYQGLTERDDQPAFNLHAMRLDGSEIEQLTFNPSHDLDPVVLSDGRIVFLRWDAFGRHNNLSLYSIRADGTELNRLYGFASQTTGTDASRAYWTRLGELEDGRLSAILKGRSASRFGGDLVAIDLYSAEAENAQVPLSTSPVDTTASTPQLGGHYHSAAPMADGSGRILLSHSPCRVMVNERISPCLPEHLAASAPEAAPLYGLWMLDPAKREKRPVKVPQEGWMFVEPTLLKARPNPTYTPPTTPVAALANEQLGAVVIGDVFALDGQRPAMPPDARYLRLYKHVPLPPDEVFEVDNAGFGRVNFMRELIGYVPLEADGSARFAAPADLAFGFELIDANFARVATRHDIWLQVRPGEVKLCGGCHAADSDNPHGRPDLDLNTLPEPITEGFALPTLDPPVEGVRYVDLLTGRTPAANCPPLDPAPPTWTPPSDCYMGDWDARCYASLDYRLHIQPLWEADRRSCDDTGAEIPDANRTCTSCHSPTGADGAQLPAAQLDLTGGVSDIRADYITSYAELWLGDNEQRINPEGGLEDVVIETPTGEFERDENGELILGEDGQPIEIIDRRFVPVAPLLNPNGAAASARFFSVFGPGGSHEGDLNPAELRLLREWLDLGGQYFNDPFTTTTE